MTLTNLILLCGFGGTVYVLLTIREILRGEFTSTIHRRSEPPEEPQEQCDFGIPPHDEEMQRLILESQKKAFESTQPLPDFTKPGDILRHRGGECWKVKKITSDNYLTAEYSGCEGSTAAGSTPQHPPAPKP